MKYSDNRSLVNYASFSNNTKGRIFFENEHEIRTPFQRDRDRILHSSAFRRLKHKTQVFLGESGDYYRTRLTHTIEVAQIARSLAYALGVNEDLTEAVSLAHDLGHPPFGHAGEEILHKKMQKYGGFDHNEQSIRIITALEKRYVSFIGLNLSWETLEAIIKHNGKIDEPSEFIKKLDNKFSLELKLNTCIEGQVASIADDIAYLSHDFDDGLKSGLITLQQIKDLPRVGIRIANILSKYTNISDDILIHEMVRGLISEFINDILIETKKRINFLSPTNSNDIRSSEENIVAFSEKMFFDLKILRSFLYKKMWRHKKVEVLRFEGQKIISDLFDFFVSDPRQLYLLPIENSFEDISDLYGNMNKDYIIRLVADNIANLTDRKAI